MKISYKSYLASLLVVASYMVCPNNLRAMDSSHSSSTSQDPACPIPQMTKPYAFLNLTKRNALFAEAKAGDIKKQDEVMEKYYGGLLPCSKGEKLSDLLNILAWNNIQDKCYVDHRYAFFILNELSAAGIKLSFPKLCDVIKEQKSAGKPKYIHLYGWLCSKSLVDDPAIEEDPGVRWFEQAGDKGVARGYYDAMEHTHWVSAGGQIDRFGRAASQGLIIAQYELGRAYEWAECPTDAVQAYTKAAQHGHPAALNRLGQMYSMGQGVECDSKKAVQLWLEAVEQEDTRAHYELGMAYYKGNGITQDLPAAIALFNKAAAQNEGIAFYALGSMHLNGHAFPKDENKAIELFKTGANKDCVNCQKDLGIRYSKGLGVLIDDSKSFEYFKKASWKDAFSTYMCGVAYHNGKGVTQNKRLAFNFYESAAREGIQGAQFALGSMYYRGINYSRKDDKIIATEQDIVKAIYWYTKSKTADALPYAKAFLRSHLRFESPSIAVSLTEDTVQKDLSLIVSSLPDSWKGCTNFRVEQCRQDVKSYLNAPQNCMILASHVSDELKEKLKQAQEEGKKSPYISLPMQHHCIDGKDFISFDDCNKVSEKLCSSLAEMAIELKQKEDTIRHCQSALNILNQTEGSRNVTTIGGVNLHIPTRDQYISYGFDFCTLNLSNAEKNHETITRIIGKTKQVIFAKGLKGQKRLLEENPMYKE